jgi:hypothetical protein
MFMTPKQLKRMAVKMATIKAASPQKPAEEKSSSLSEAIEAMSALMEARESYAPDPEYESTLDPSYQTAPPGYPTGYSSGPAPVPIYSAPPAIVTQTPIGYGTYPSSSGSFSMYPSGGSTPNPFYPQVSPYAPGATPISTMPFATTQYPMTVGPTGQLTVDPFSGLPAPQTKAQIKAQAVLRKAYGQYDVFARSHGYIPAGDVFADILGNLDAATNMFYDGEACCASCAAKEFHDEEPFFESSWFRARLADLPNGLFGRVNMSRRPFDVEINRNVPQPRAEVAFAHESLHTLNEMLKWGLTHEQIHDGAFLLVSEVLPGLNAFNHAYNK